jgi:hypothetical protein
MMVMSDVVEPFVPLREGMLVGLEESRDVIVSLLEQVRCLAQCGCCLAPLWLLFGSIVAFFGLATHRRFGRFHCAV